MFLSREYKFLFLKTRKVAGTSVEIALSKFAGPKDIITWIPPESEAVRKRLGYAGPQNKGYNPAQDKALFTQHMTAQEIFPALGAGLWNDLYKFTIERNPWDKAVSFYYWRVKTKLWQEKYGDNPPSFEDFVRSDVVDMAIDYDRYSLNGTPAMDEYILYDNLTEGLEQLGRKLGLPEVLDMSAIKANAHQRPSRKYQDMYMPGTKEIIAQKFGREIEFFGFEF